MATADPTTKISSPDISTKDLNNTEDMRSGDKDDPYKALERSQSEAALFGHKRKETGTEVEVVDGPKSAQNSSHNISECSKVYFDLSKGETFEEHKESHTLFATSRSTSGRFLETIHQNEELHLDEVALNYRSNRSISVGSTSSIESVDMKFPQKQDTDKSDSKSSVIDTTKLQGHFDTFCSSMREKIPLVFSDSQEDQINSLNEINTIIEQSWAIPAIGRDLAYGLSDVFRLEKALDVLIQNCRSDSRPLLLASSRLLEQVMTTKNREHVVSQGLESVVQMCVQYKSDAEITQITTGILESLFKTSEETCGRVIKLGGLDVILFCCRGKDRLTLRHCAIALANLSLYGGPQNHHLMVHHKAPEWLFPLAFNKDDSVRYYACLAISVLVADKNDKKMETAVMNSGTLELVLPFVSSHTPSEFARMDLWHRHGRSRDWLRRLVPLLSSKREEPQALAAFHFAMEAGIKREQGRKTAFHEIDAVEPLKRVASSSPSVVASKLAVEALKTIGESVPHKLSQRVPQWSVDEVVHWVATMGFPHCCENFRLCQVDGDLLLRITDDDLVDSIHIQSSLSRKRFLRELKDLKISADYTSCDLTKLHHWLIEISHDMGQYTYQLLQAGVDRHFLLQVTEENLQVDCGIQNGVHRAKILQSIREQAIQSVCTPSSEDLTDAGTVCSNRKTIDAFISYRRYNGSQLASLLKVHLQLRGFSVFLDIERLSAGKFDESLLQSIAQSTNFILVLTPGALDRCKGDTERKDWVHREIVTALECGCNIIPLTDNFDWLTPDQLPEDMRQICYFNGIKWIHDYQDACVEKLERFLKGEKNHKLYGLGSSLEDTSPLKTEAAMEHIAKTRKGNNQGLVLSLEDNQ